MRREMAVLALGLLTALQGCSKKEDGAPKLKSKEEFLQVLDKHKDTYVRCEKLRRELQPVASEGKASGAPKNAGGEYQKCMSGYWASVTKDVGPFDQAKADEWYAEWSRGVKVD